MPRRIIGIDPGKEGAIAVLEDYDGNRDLVTYALSDVTSTVFHDIVSAPYSTVVIEKASARPGQGTVSMFTFGTGFGRLLGWCEAFRVRHVLVPPATWTREMHTGTSAKEPKLRSLEAVVRLFPDADIRAGKKQVHKGIVDALLIAEWGRRHAC